MLSAVAFGENRKPLIPSSKDKCPVCGMFVSKYPDWIAEIIFKDGSYAIFDGAKDMFKYYLNLKKYNPAKKDSDVDRIFVKDYYSLTFVDGFQGYYVLGSDVYGPMGKEFIPFEKEKDAAEFMLDHRGKSILKFKDIQAEVMKELD